MIKILKLILNFFKKLSCKLGFCCGSKCNSECGPKTDYMDGSIIPEKKD